ncbi:MAG: mycothiol synthase [Acidimicrobiales bacterium]|jgi:mycothiol synthase
MDRVEVVLRRDDEEAVGIAALVSAATEALGHRPLDDETWRELVAGRPAGDAAFLARLPHATELVGYAQLDRGSKSWGLSYVLDPGATDALSIGRSLCRAALGFVAGEGGGLVRSWVRLPTVTSDGIAASVGMTAERQLHQMRRPLPVEAVPSQPIATRPFRAGVDDPAFLELNNRAFAGHPEQGAWRPETLARRERAPWFDPAGLLLHERDGRMLAFCWTKVHDLEPPVGEIYVLGVDPDAQDRGLGQAMLHAGLAHLSGKGLRMAMLYVDAANVRATRLFRDAGFEIDHDDRAYVGRVEAAR